MAAHNDAYVDIVLSLKDVWNRQGGSISVKL